MAGIDVTKLRQFFVGVQRSIASVPLKDWSEIAKNLAQVIALVAAGIWTYEMFIAKEAATLQRHATTGGSFYWDPPTGEGCLGNYYVTLKNDGITDFDVRRVVVTMWEFPVSNPVGGVEFVDIDKVTGGNSIWRRTYSELDSSDHFLGRLRSVLWPRREVPVVKNSDTPGVFVRHFPPGHERRQRFAWFFKKEPRRNIYISAQFFTDIEGTKPEWEQNYWWEVCKPPEKES